jgi:cytidylate kinase|nr:cytidylate kinase-like family protein [uncultured Prevotella sp.]
MNISDQFVITINREFGSGGHEIGRLLAQRLQVKLMDRQILKAVAERYHLTEEQTEKLELRHPSWWDDFAKFYQDYTSKHEYKASGRDITSRQLFFAQAEAMKDIASRESCVVVGRCGFHVFREDPLALKVFVYAPLADRIERIEGRYNIREDKARQMISDHDYTRQLYTRTFTGKEWYDTRNYQLTLNAGTLGIEGAVDFLVDFVGKFWKGRMR